MSDDEVHVELLALLRESLGIASDEQPATTGVLESAQHVYDNSIDVSLDFQGTVAAASSICKTMQEKDYTFKAWSDHELHPKSKDEAAVQFIFVMDLLNFCFWSDRDDADTAFSVAYRGKLWTGYWSLVAALQRALEEGTKVSQNSSDEIRGA